ncbi:MAG: hypothetical protein FRX49_08741 [Trebouxia sp. A1-2]|nr:MAG: hypothetical protein FRX49_08741 [Trebouxia sp. A1-2]
MSQQQYLMAILAVLLVSASTSGATRNRLLLSSESPPNSQTINSILSKNVMVFTFGEKTQVPVPILNGAADVGAFSTPVAPSSNRNTETSTILFACRAVGNQIYTTTLLMPTFGVALGLQRLPSSTSFPCNSKNGGAPSFEAVDGSGIAIGQKVATTSATSMRSGDGGLGSVGDVLLSINGQGSLSDVTWIIRNNELGGQIAPNQQPLALASTNLENFALTGAENVPNAPLFVPYQADYTFFTGARPTFPQPGVVTGSPPSTSSSG